MKFLISSLLILIGFISYAQEPLIRYNYFEDDFSPFKTYHINFFKLNGKEVGHESNIRTKLLVEKLHERMQKTELNRKDKEGDIYFNYHLQVDTLPIAFQRPEGPLPQDIVAEITIDIFDAEYNERLFTSNVYGLLVDDRKNGKMIKKIYRKLFRELVN
ncbi:MAG: DUF4136 domain-containing protein [Cyclobacteriaceae bacterium]